ncbi:MAG: O-antigen ligase family protein [Blautia wexlerae]
MKVKKLDLVAVIISILLVHISLIQRIASWQSFFYIRWGMATILFFFLMVNIKVIVKRDFNPLLLLFIIIFCCCSIYSSYLNRNGSMFHVGIFHVVFFVDTFGTLKYIKEKNKTSICINTICIVLGMYCFLNDILMMASRSQFFGNGNFLLYSKFLIAYLHLILITLYASKNNKNNKYLFALWCWTVIICMYMECSTGIQGAVVMLILYLLPKQFLSVLKNQFVAIATMIGCSVILILKNAIIDIPVVQHIIVNILHESTDLNSRLFIYNNLYKIMKINPFWGFGAENNYVACQRYLIISEYESAPDAQNGLIDWFISYGSIGTVVLLVIVFLCFAKAKKNYNLYLMVMLYVFFVLGSIEIVFDITFFFVLASYLYLESLERFAQNKKIKR